MNILNNKGRVQDRDYRRAGVYFITVVTYQRQQLLSQVLDDTIWLTKLGLALQKAWLDTMIIRADMKLYMADLIVMPDHFHGLIEIGKNEFNSGADFIKESNQFGPQTKNLGSIVRGIKASVTMEARLNGIPEKIWQPKYYERQLFSEQSIFLARKYIRENPKRWNR